MSARDPEPVKRSHHKKEPHEEPPKQSHHKKIVHEEEVIGAVKEDIHAEKEAVKEEKEAIKEDKQILTEAHQEIVKEEKKAEEAILDDHHEKEVTKILKVKEALSVGYFLNLLRWPWVAEKFNTIQHYMNLKEVIKVGVAWLLAGGTSVGLLETFSKEIGHVVVNHGHAEIAKASITVVVSVIGLVSALRVHLNNGVKVGQMTVVTTLTKNPDQKPQV